MAAGLAGVGSFTSFSNQPLTERRRVGPKTRPYETGHSEDVIEVKWKAGSVYCPPGGWFHQHFNTGAQPARHLALRYGSRIHPIGFKIADKRSEDGVYVDVKKGGTLLEYADEDPYIRKHYEDEMRKNGIPSQMPSI